MRKLAARQAECTSDATGGSQILPLVADAQVWATAYSYLEHSDRLPSTAELSGCGLNSDRRELQADTPEMTGISNAIDEAMRDSVDRIGKSLQAFTELISARREAIAQSRIRTRPQEHDAELTCLLEWVGLENDVDGLIAKPGPDVVALDLDLSGTDLRVDAGAEWFPYEIMLPSERVAVRGADGSIFVSVRGLSKGEQEVLKSQVLSIADALYLTE